jgi:hypothetical protein
MRSLAVLNCLRRPTSESRVNMEWTKVRALSGCTMTMEFFLRSRRYTWGDIDRRAWRSGGEIVSVPAPGASGWMVGDGAVCWVRTAPNPARHRA